MKYSIPLTGYVKWAVLLLALSPAPVLACEAAQVESVLHAAYPQAQRAGSNSLQRVDGSSSIVLSEVACKQWPARPELLLLAVPLWTAIDPDGLSTGDLEVIVADIDRASVRARYREHGRLDSDAWYFNGVSLDTARYQLTDDLRAFGTRVEFRGSSRVNPRRESSLTLYVLREHTLEPVLQQLIVDTSAAEWDGRCTGEWAQLQRMVAVVPGKGSGWADLAVRSLTTRSTTRDIEGECVESETKSSTVDRIRFDGRAYPIPARLADWPNVVDG